MPVNTKSKSIEDNTDDLELVLALWGGTRTMRAAGTTYLPQEAGEETDAYNNRKARTTLTNIFKKTVNTFAGRIFEDPVMVEKQTGLDPFLENVDLEGRDFHRFSYDLTRFTLRDGIRFILVDAPVAEDVKTKADENKAGVRPYFVEVDLRQVLGWKLDVSGSKRLFTQFRFMEIVEDGSDEFTQTVVEQIRVIEPNNVRLYRKDGAGQWFLYQTTVLIPFLPLDCSYPLP